MVKSRITAGLIHLGISAVLLGGLCLVIFLIWYPGAYFVLAGAMRPLQALVLVDLVIGPLLTLIVYKVGKPSLKFDLAVIAVLQLAAFAYGTWTLAQQRPAFLAYEGGVFHVISSVDVNEPAVPERVQEIRNFFGPTTVWASPAADPTHFMSVVMDGVADIYLLPQQYYPLEQGRQDLEDFGEVLTLALLDQDQQLNQRLRETGLDVDELLANGRDLRLYPALGRVNEGAALVDVSRATVETLVVVTMDVVRYRPQAQLPGAGSQPGIEQE